MIYPKSLRKFSLVLFCFMVGGCVTRYEDVMRDKNEYVRTTFSPSTISGSVISAIKGDEGNTLPFSKVVYKQIPHITTTTAPNESNKIERENIVTMTAVGGPYITVMEEVTTNSVVVQTNFRLAYRGIISLKNQFIIPGRPNASFISEVKDLSSFSNASNLKPGSEISYEYTIGSRQQLANFKKYKLTCKVGPEFAASTINQKLSGNAMTLKCQTLDEFGTVIDTGERAYLQKYGIAIGQKHSSATFTTDFEVKDIQFFQ